MTHKTTCICPNLCRSIMTPQLNPTSCLQGCACVRMRFFYHCSCIIRSHGERHKCLERKSLNTSFTLAWSSLPPVYKHTQAHFYTHTPSLKRFTQTCYRLVAFELVKLQVESQTETSELESGSENHISIVPLSGALNSRLFQGEAG